MSIGTGGRHALLWGGPEDGAAVWLPPGDPPARVGVHRTGDGALVPVRGRALLHEAAGHPAAGHLQVYERATVGVLRAAYTALRGRPPAAGYRGPPMMVETDGLLYVWRELVTRWTAEP